MSLSRVTTWSSGQVLTASALNGEFDNILSNALSLISPLTAGLDAGGFDLTNLDEVELASAGANATAAGRIRRNATNLTWHDGTAARRFALKTTSDEFIFADAAVDASAAGYLTRNGVNLTWHNGTAAGRIFFAGGTDVPVADGGTGVSTTPSNGQLLIGNGTGYTVANVTAGTGITVTNGAGTISLATTGIIVQDRVTSDVTVGNTTTETTVYSYSVPGNTLSTNKLLRVTLLGKISTTASSPVFTIRLKFGASVSAGATLTTNASGITDNALEMIGYVAADGATNAQTAWLIYSGEQVSSSQQLQSGERDTGTEDTTGNITISVTVQWGAADASNTYTMEYATLELV